MYDFRRLQRALLLALAAGLFSPAQSHEGEEHGTHDARNGGLVLMYNDLHYELVLRPEGGVRIYYSDAIRMELPAATVSDVVVEIDRGGEIEYVTMVMSDGGDYWHGESRPVTAPDTLIRTAFLFQGEPVVAEIPFEYIAETIERQSAMLSPFCCPSAATPIHIMNLTG